MKQYKKFGVRLPLDASARRADASKRTDIQKTVLLRSIILNGIAKEHDALPDTNLPGSDQAALNTHQTEWLQMSLEPNSKKTFSSQHMPNGSTRIFCTFIRAGDSAILLEIMGAEDNPKTGHRWYDRVKYFVEYVIRNFGTLVFVWKLMQV